MRDNRFVGLKLALGVGAEYESDVLPLALNEYTHLVAVWEGGAGGTASLYLDGELRQTVDIRRDSQSNTNYFCLNTNAGSPENHAWIGCMSQVRVYNYAVTADEVAQLFEDATSKINSCTPAQTVPIYRYYSTLKGDHFYTNSFEELGRATSSDYDYENIGFYLLSQESGFSVPLHRYWKESVGDHFYTADANEIGTKTIGEMGNFEYVYEGMIGHCFPEEAKTNDMVPLHRYFKASIANHFYTIYDFEIGSDLQVGEVGNSDYKYEGIECFVFAE